MDVLVEVIPVEGKFSGNARLDSWARHLFPNDSFVIAREKGKCHLIRKANGKEHVIHSRSWCAGDEHHMHSIVDVFGLRLEWYIQDRDSSANL